MRFSPNGRATQLDFDVEMIRVSQAETKMAAINRKKVRKRNMSASIQDSDEILTAIPTFSGSGNKMGLVTILCDVRGTS